MNLIVIPLVIGIIFCIGYLVRGIITGTRDLKKEGLLALQRNGFQVLLPNLNSLNHQDKSAVELWNQFQRQIQEFLPRIKFPPKYSAKSTFSCDYIGTSSSMTIYSLTVPLAMGPFPVATKILISEAKLNKTFPWFLIAIRQNASEFAQNYSYSLPEIYKQIINNHLITAYSDEEFTSTVKLLVEKIISNPTLSEILVNNLISVEVFDGQVLHLYSFQAIEVTGKNIDFLTKATSQMKELLSEFQVK